VEGREEMEGRGLKTKCGSTVDGTGTRDDGRREGEGMGGLKGSDGL